MSENIVSSFQTSDSQKMIYFTQKMVIIAKVGKKTGARAGYALGGMTGYAIGRSMDKRAAKKKGEKLGKLTPEEILKDSKDNYSIPYSEIEKVEMKKHRIKIIANSRFGKDMKKKKDKTTRKDVYEYEKELKKTKEFEEQVNALRPVLSTKFEVM